MNNHTNIDTKIQNTERTMYVAESTPVTPEQRKTAEQFIFEDIHYFFISLLYLKRIPWNSFNKFVVTSIIDVSSS